MATQVGVNHLLVLEHRHGTARDQELATGSRVYQVEDEIPGLALDLTGLRQDQTVSAAVGHPLLAALRDLGQVALELSILVGVDPEVESEGHRQPAGEHGVTLALELTSRRSHLLLVDEVGEVANGRGWDGLGEVYIDVLEVAAEGA